MDPVTGSSIYRLPFRLTPGRSEFGPELALEYDSRWGNSPFGYGWRVHVPSIGRRTRPDVPRYREADDDTFELGDEELVPALRVSGGWIDDRFTVGEYLVQRYRRRFEYPHDRIERWLHQPSGQTHWRVVDADNVTSMFGANDQGRVCDAGDSSRILRWLLTERFDDRGNIIRYVYKHEDLVGVDLDSDAERHRRQQSDAESGTRYLKRVQYGNAAPHDRGPWHFDVVFDYGEHNDDPTPEEATTWGVRPDPYSSYRGGFETRTWRRCKRVLMFHNFEDLGPAPYLVSSTDLTYDDRTGRSLLSEVTHSGYIRRNEGTVERKTLPQLSMRYQHPEFDDTVHTVDAEDVVGALLDERSRARWVDLHGESLPGLMLQVGGSWVFVRNHGGGEFSEPQAVPEEVAVAADESTVVDLTTEATPRQPAHDR